VFLNVVKKQPRALGADQPMFAATRELANMVFVVGIGLFG
jgi:hypothetical protein